MNVLKFVKNHYQADCLRMYKEVVKIAAVFTNVINVQHVSRLAILVIRKGTGPMSVVPRGKINLLLTLSKRLGLVLFDVVILQPNIL